MPFPVFLNLKKSSLFLADCFMATRHFRFPCFTDNDNGALSGIKGTKTGQTYRAHCSCIAGQSVSLVRQKVNTNVLAFRKWLFLTLPSERG
ncbi:MAG: hypothetical protein F8N36_11890 [Desulfovibrio sp.]|uniref:hypothetical protein n=1 Tax=Desulfovibrio sp. TaxID=885 RepID=UPI00135DC6BF|nr:hypothetical protein [Desulfovibrio sp.]MTJ93549.1 hypothetical protein [Desulfovibrio sp.]